MARTLYFQTILDSRFCKISESDLSIINKRITDALVAHGLLPVCGEIYYINWDDGTTQLRTNFFVHKSKTTKVKWDNVYSIIASTYKPVPYKFVNR